MSVFPPLHKENHGLEGIWEAAQNLLVRPSHPVLIADDLIPFAKCEEQVLVA